MNSPAELSARECVSIRPDTESTSELSLVRVILGGLIRLLTTPDTHVMELETTENSTFRQLSCPDPVLALTVNCTSGAGSSE